MIQDLRSGVRMLLKNPGFTIVAARPVDLLNLVLRQGLKLALIGIAVGLLITLAFTRLMTGLLYGVGAADPITLLVDALRNE
jgi:putative ABC transport system permease protein